MNTSVEPAAPILRTEDGGIRFLQNAVIYLRYVSGIQG